MSASEHSSDFVGDHCTRVSRWVLSVGTSEPLVHLAHWMVGPVPTTPQPSTHLVPHPSLSQVLGGKLSLNTVNGGGASGPYISEPESVPHPLQMDSLHNHK